jgi:ubiquinone/menaquinone biosynthesis C-methylase UbiE
LNHDDHVELIRAGITVGGIWADFGSGTGAFTLALRELAGPEVQIWSVDRSRSSLEAQARAFEGRFPGSRIEFLTADFTRELELPPLEGIVAANSIHFVRDRVALLRSWKRYLKPGGRIVLVEYDTDSGNQWVPFPVSFKSLGRLAREAGFTEPDLVGTHPSRYHDRMYAARLDPAGTPATYPR